MPTGSAINVMALGFKRKTVNSDVEVPTEPPISSKYAEILGSSAVTPGEAGGGSSLYAIGQVHEISVLKLVANPVNAREIYSAASLTPLMESMRVSGQQIPVQGYVLDQSVILVDGHRRLNAAIKLGFTTLKVEVVTKPPSEKELYLASRLANSERQAQTALDDALVWRRLLDRNMFASQAELAASVGVHYTEVSRTLTLCALSPAVITYVSEYPDLLTLRMLSAVRDFEEAHGTESTLALLHDVVTHGYGYREVLARKKAKQAPPRTRSTPEAHPVAFRQAKGTLKTFPTAGRLELVLKGLTEEATQELISRINRVLTEDPQTA